MRSSIGSASIRLFNLVFPGDCRICEKPLHDVSRIPVCAACLALVQPLEAEFFCHSCRTPFASPYSLNDKGLCEACDQSIVGFDNAYSYGAYDGPLRELIHLFKYGKVETIAQPLARFLAVAVPLDQQFDLIIAMPMHWFKRWQRGFNQAELLAKPIAHRYGLKLSKDLVRKKYTKAQAGLSAAERQNNLKDSFQVRNPQSVKGRRVLLIDDVFTTGATLRAASAALKAAGANHVSALTLARVDRRWNSTGSDL